ncbi:MAG: tryptophan--tRNA ligase [Acidobacteria bacterium]|mgnify:CR=1 FL=1|nr:MAG: tryptophan--tRNA ligase [Acidobacteriota bacterium]REK02680.1 MAG: tryptophan--tRNA ligase [Acidobacteriota bacterium]REK13515.1 MAG: tryptophan--tRNA ligase [Acidobacteriota bacterium]REK41509.1 MAG: tryptophan--tRNA ligase [Acidobacteriota bacterium]
MRKRIFSGAQPTGELHLGNYLGALKNWVALQTEYESFYCIVNLHAITLPQDPATLRQKTLDLARIYLAAGVDPERSTIFIQSDVPEHAELAWVLNCVARMGELERMTQFKDKGKGEERASVGLFTYPVLMASDILLYQTDLVPVGQDQKQHLELTRDLAERFNRDFGETFVVPDPYIPPVGAAIMSLKEPEKKMSKSDENLNSTIFLLDDADTITKKYKKAVTDSGTEITFDGSRPAISNLLTIYHLLSGKPTKDCEAHFEGKGYGDFKSELAEVTIEFLKPFQERVREYDDDSLEAILKSGAEKASAVASETLKNVYQSMGIR